MTNKVAVRMNGYPFAFFNTAEEANRFIEIFKVEQAIRQSQLDYIDQAVDTSDLHEAKEVINHIMELK
tara:strand:- start:276 stop:479 length:204 start_codon:yes stop_codon:yes gene_type:complete